MARYSSFSRDANHCFANGPGLSNVDHATAPGMADPDSVERFKLRLNRLKGVEMEKDKLIEVCPFQRYPLTDFR